MDWSDRIGRRLKLPDLPILMAVADTGSMAKAAARLRISHPAVSKAISEIEGTLGVRLFDRGSQGAELTAYGKVLLRCGINVFGACCRRSFRHSRRCSITSTAGATTAPG